MIMNLKKSVGYREKVENGKGRMEIMLVKNSYMIVSRKKTFKNEIKILLNSTRL